MRYSNLIGKLRSGGRTLWWWTYTRFPGFVPEFEPSPRCPDEKSDTQANKRTAVPEGEAVDLKYMWAFEAYGPAEIDALYCGLHKLGWDRQSEMGFRENCIEWIKSQRLQGFCGSLNVGIAQGSAGGPFVPSGLVADFPPGVEFADVTLYQVCPSLTVLQVMFALDDNARRLYESEINREGRTEFEPIRNKVGAYSVYDPPRRKIRAIKRVRLELQNAVESWIKSSLPGMFCTSLKDAIPTAECVVTKVSNVLEGRKESGENVSGWGRLLVGGAIVDSWRCVDSEGFMLASIGERGNRPHVLVAVSESGITENEVRMYGGLDASSTMSIVKNRVSDVLAQFGLLALLEAVRRKLAVTRDALNVVGAGEMNAIRSLRAIQEFFAHDVQIPNILRELYLSTSSFQTIFSVSPEFVQVASSRHQGRIELREMARKSINVAARQLSNDDAATRDALKQLSDVVAAGIGVAAQRTMRRLTGWIIALSIVTLVATVFASPMGKEVVTSADFVFKWVRSHA